MKKFENLRRKYDVNYVQIIKKTCALTEVVTQRCSVKKVFLEILQNSQENTRARVSFLIKLQARGLRKSSNVTRHSESILYADQEIVIKISLNIADFQLYSGGRKWGHWPEIG